MCICLLDDDKKHVQKRQSLKREAIKRQSYIDSESSFNLIARLLMDFPFIEKLDCTSAESLANYESNIANSRTQYISFSLYSVAAASFLCCSVDAVVVYCSSAMRNCVYDDCDRAPPFAAMFFNWQDRA